MNREQFEAYVKQMEADKQGKADLIAFIRSHDNYPQWLESGQKHGWVRPLKAMRKRPLAELSIRELIFLASWISGPAYLIDEISR